MNVPKLNQDLFDFGYVCVYEAQRRLGLSDRAGLYEAFPNLFVERANGVYCKQAGEALVDAVSMAVAVMNEEYQVKDAKVLVAQREIVVAIAQEFSENSVRALADSIGKNAAAETIAARALRRMDKNRRKKPEEDK